MQRTILLTGLFVLIAGSAQAAVLCKKKSGVIAVRDTCKAKETRLDPDALGLRGSQGVKGDKGDPGQSVQGPTGPAGPALVVKDANGTFVGLGGGGGIVRRINGQLFQFNVRDTGFVTDSSGPSFEYFTGDCTGVPYTSDAPEPSNQLQSWSVYGIYSAPTPEGANAYYTTSPAIPGSIYSIRSYTSNPSACTGTNATGGDDILVAPNYCCYHYLSPWATGNFYPVTQVDLGVPILGLVPPFHVEGP